MAEVENGQSLRNSTGKLKAKGKGVDDVPNYLRASTGSCHDACKYGTSHEFKARPKRSVRRSMPKAEIPVEIFVPSDKRSTKAVKPSSVVPDASLSNKIEDAKGAPKSNRQQAASSTKVRSSHVSKQIDRESSSAVKSLSPDSLNLVKQETSLDVNSLSPESSKLDKQDSSFDVNSSSHESLTSAKQESSLDVKSSPTDSSISVEQEASSDVKTPTFASLRKGSSSQRNSSNASKSTPQDVQSRRKPSSSNVSGPVRQSASKPARSPHLMSGSIGKTSIVGRNSSLPDASKMVKREVISSNGKAPLKNNTSTKSGVSLKSKPNRASTQQTPSPNLLGRKSGNISSGSKIDYDSRTSKAASKKNTGSPTTSLSLKTRKNSLTSSTNALTPNLPGTEVARLNVRKNISQKEGSGKLEATSDDLNGSSDSKKPENEKVVEKTLHMIEVESNQSPGSFDSLCQSKSPFSSQDAVETNSESDYTESDADDSDAVNIGKGKVLGLEGNGSAPVKLKFRRGIVVDPQSDVNSPRRLRFRRRSVSGKETKAVGVKVVLRHQGVQEKKNEQGLLNVVIEETASKLVETRKSKVKALVGAFETVISLQESKLSGDKHSPH